ncbi:MAG: TonB-dependent siderophore receptor [Opitutaceae bacterium]
MRTIRLWPFVAAILPGAVVLHAQVSPTSPASSAAAEPLADEEAITLSPFEVSTDEDTGYRAVNSLSGGRTNLEIGLIPSAISAMTSEFMDDLSIVGIQESYFWTLNAGPQNLRQEESVFGEYQYNIRGIESGGGSPPTRNYFQFYAASDAYNTERIEFARGPNSIVYGDAQLGGLPTTWTKVPRLDEDLHAGRFLYDSYGSIRTSFDLNKRAGDNLAVRVNGLFQRGKDWRDGITRDKDAITLAARYRLTDKTEVRAETEWSRERRLTYQINHFDQASYWDGETTYDGGEELAASPQALQPFGLATLGARRDNGTYQPHFVIIPAVPEAGFSDWGNFYQTTGTGVALMETPRAEVPNSPVLPSKEFTMQPPDAISFNRFQTTTLWFDHRFSDNFEAQLSYYYFDDGQDSFNESINAYRLDVNTMMPTPTGLQPNPKFGVPFAESTVGRQFQERTVNEVRGLATLRFETDAGGLDLRQRFTVAGGRRWFNFDLITYFQRRVSPNPDVRADENFVFYRLYWDEPRQYSITDLPNIPGVDIRYVPAFFTTHTDQVLDYGQILSNTTLWDERVSLVAGIRYDTYDQEQRDPIQTASGSALQPPVAFGDNETTYSAGAVVYPLPWRGVGAFFNYSENFLPSPPGAPSFDGRPFGPISGSGYDFGLRFNLLDNRIYLTASRYDSEQSGNLENAPLGPLRDIWRGFGVPEGDPRRDILFREPTARTAEGYEFEITANPWDNFRLTAGYALPETATVERRADTRTYAAMFRAEWEAALANDTAANPTQLQNGLNNLDQELLTAVNGATLNNTLDYTAHVYGTYSFTEGPLDGVSVGAGAYFRGREKIGSVDPRILFDTDSPTPEQRAESSFAYTYAPSYYNVAMHIAYIREFGEKTARFQINIDNVLDDDDPRFRGVNVYNEGGISGNPLVQTPGAFNYPDPRKVTFTASVEF